MLKRDRIKRKLCKWIFRDETLRTFVSAHTKEFNQPENALSSFFIYFILLHMQQVEKSLGRETRPAKTVVE